MKRLILIRHGETAVNAKGVMHQTDDIIGLNDAGQEQARCVAAELVPLNVDYIVTSNTVRTRQTTEIISQTIGYKVITTPDMRERDWGEWSGRSWSEIQETLSPMSLDERYAFVPPQGESWRDFEARLKHTLSEVEKLPFNNVAIVAHGGVLRALMPIVLKQPKESSFQYDFHNASISIFDYDHKHYSPVKINDISHLTNKN